MKKLELTDNGVAVAVTAPVALFATEVLARGGGIGLGISAAAIFVAARHGGDIKNLGARLIGNLAQSKMPTEEEIAALMASDLPSEEDIIIQIRKMKRQEAGFSDEMQQQLGKSVPNTQRPEDDNDLDLARPKPRGIFLFSEILERFIPTLERIYLATLPNGTSIFCDYKALCHVALAGATDAGKSNIMRMLIAQLCYVGAKVLVLNPHWTGYVLDKQEDWTPIVPFLFDDPKECRAYDKIEYYLNYLANKTIPRRLDLFAESRPTGKPIFVVIDELPAIVKRLKTVPGYLDTILKEGRKVGVYLISAAQDFLVDTIGGTGAVRDCYRTAYSVGGDDTTTNKLLGKTKADRPLGKGVVLLRNASNDLCKEAVTALVPYVDNESLYRLLGPSTYEPSDVDIEELEDFELDDAKARTVGDMRRAPTETEPAATIKPNIPDKGPKATDFSINILCAAWNGGINTVSKIETEFKMSHREAYKAYNLVKAQRGEPVEEQE